LRAVFGLGNPGSRYSKNRHNIGFEIVAHYIDQYNVPFRAGKGDYYYAEIEIARTRAIFVKPVTYMNRSGFAVRHVLDYFPVDLSDILVIYDDFHLPFGTFRFRTGGSDGGHNGIRSIIDVIGTDMFHRFRFGIGEGFTDAVDYVLSNFTRAEQKKLTELFPVAMDAITCWFEQGIEQTMNKYNRSYSL
jgi:PTH1 family peptidyl-tRNA hydrolase